ncbi:MAG: ABC transporter permease, partial [Candidatus Thorarchaeota archaeon]
MSDESYTTETQQDFPIEEKPNIIGSFFGGLIKKISSPAFQKTIVVTMGSIILAMLVGTLVMIIVGYNAGLAWIALIQGAVVRFDRVLFYATPLIFTGLSVALAFKCGLFNIGPEGQLFIGAISAAIVGFSISLPVVIHPLVALAFAALTGGLWGFIPGLLKAYRGAHEVVTTMMLSYTAIILTHWLVSGPFLEPGNEYVLETPDILVTAELPKIFGSFLSWAFIVAVVAVFAVDFLINRTVLGYELRAVGINREAAEASGINAKRNIALALGIAGALAGLGGAGEILGYHQRFVDGFSSGLGWDGITVAVLGGNNPFGVLAGAIFFGALRAGGNQMQTIANVPLEVISLMQGLIVIFVAAPRIIDWLIDRGYDEARWIKELPKEGTPHFLTLGTTLVTSVIAFASIGRYFSLVAIQWTVAGGLLFICGVLGFIAFILMF